MTIQHGVRSAPGHFRPRDIADYLGLTVETVARAGYVALIDRAPLRRGFALYLFCALNPSSSGNPLMLLGLRRTMFPLHDVSLCETCFLFFGFCWLDHVIASSRQQRPSVKRSSQGAEQADCRGQKSNLHGTLQNSTIAIACPSATTSSSLTSIDFNVPAVVDYRFDECNVIAVADIAPDFDRKCAHAPGNLGNDLDLWHPTLPTAE
jgi:hypothetical protein